MAVVFILRNRHTALGSDNHNRAYTNITKIVIVSQLISKIPNFSGIETFLNPEKKNFFPHMIRNWFYLTRPRCSSDDWARWKTLTHELILRVIAFFYQLIFGRMSILYINLPNVQKKKNKHTADKMVSYLSCPVLWFY